MDASLNKKLQEVEWGEFRLDNLFNIEGTKSLDSNAIEFTKTGINFVGRTFENNGIQGKIQKRSFEPNEPFTITATVIGNYKYVKYQKEPYYCSQNINKLTPLPIFSKWNDKIAYFLVANIQNFVSLYNGQQGGYKLDDIKNHVIQLPIKNGKINFEFMESFITELEACHISELKAYLSVTGLNDYTLTKEEENALNIFNSINWDTYTVKDIFEVLSYKKRFDANKVKILENGKYPYVVRMNSNNGQNGYISEPEEFLNDGNTISFGQDTATMFYQEKPYFTGDKIKILKPKYVEFNKKNAQFFLTALRKTFSSFSWGTSSYNVDIIEGQKVFLPVLSNEIDFDYMETLISAIQKLVIKDVVLYSENKMNEIKKFVAKE
ncbi:MAG: restriction endonuclease subunit S [Clostridia bacterium]|nr:restriction endonuclease subunit S [Clostridia bacterium]